MMLAAAIRTRVIVLLHLHRSVNRRKGIIAVECFNQVHVKILLPRDVCQLIEVAGLVPDLPRFLITAVATGV